MGGIILDIVSSLAVILTYIVLYSINFPVCYKIHNVNNVNY